MRYIRELRAQTLLGMGFVNNLGYNELSFLQIHLQCRPMCVVQLCRFDSFAKKRACVCVLDVVCYGVAANLPSVQQT